MELRIVCMLAVVCLSVMATYSRKRTMTGSAGMYCAGPLLRTIPQRSALECAQECRRDSQCGSYSVRQGSRCLLHGDFCSKDDLVSESGSFYTEVAWECFGSSCYYMPTLLTIMTKAEADAVCEALGAHVVATETQEENDLVSELVYETAFYPVPGDDEKGRCYIWIDLINDITWHHSGENATYTNWRNEAVSDPLIEHCTVLIHTGRWQDKDCASQYSFLCEKDRK